MDKEMERGYQADFYTLSSGVRDAARRQRKAQKIYWALTTFAADLLPAKCCLDVGCSSGLMTAAVAPLFTETIGLDFDATALTAIATPTRELVHFLRGDALCLPFANNSVDAVLCAQVYEHVPNDESLVAEIYRVLRPGGVVFFSGPNWLFPIEPHYFLPFLHWLPPHWAGALLKTLGKGEEYYERSRSLWGLRRLFHAFTIQDITVELLHTPFLVQSPRLRWLGTHIPAGLWPWLQPLLPNYNWILRKPAA